MTETASAPTPTPQKTKEQLEADQEAAKQQIQQLLDTSRPKNLRHGVVSGLGNVVSGCVGMVGMVVLAPTLGATVGAKQGGIVGGTVYVIVICHHVIR